MRLVAKNEVYILVIVLVYILHSWAYEYMGTTKSVEWVASFYLLDYLIVALMSFLIDASSLLCRLALNTLGVLKTLCALFVVVAYVYSDSLADFWIKVDNIAPFYMVILISIGLSILIEWMRIKGIKIL